jgi:hypothetical protein
VLKQNINVIKLLQLNDRVLSSLYHVLIMLTSENLFLLLEAIYVNRYIYACVCVCVRICEGGPKNNWNLNVARELEEVARCAAMCRESTLYSSSLPRGVSLG